MGKPWEEFNAAPVSGTALGHRADVWTVFV